MLQVIDRDNLKKIQVYRKKKQQRQYSCMQQINNENSFKMSKQKSKSTKMKLKT